MNTVLIVRVGTLMTSKYNVRNLLRCLGFKNRGVLLELVSRILICILDAGVGLEATKYIRDLETT